ncbi:hypothetical protein Q4F19_09520 [Sphingomonas sp. BIUV-7]|uniref:DUF4136 domain-containing protein n=1 Tax=Sphingomonas natans TaxID=3063330 RepID=A0ABT8Y8H8_9SPHN|nr:hypothetical protein [Sphingomonas sp. BIUV-7]MDO6414618.1 hypothetical protein [Sphingomonas sp. BIUV-7]
MIPFAMVMLALGEQPTDAVLPVSGTISMRAMQSGNSARSLEAPFVNAVGQAFSDRGFTTLDGQGHARFTADIKVSRDQLGTTSAAASKSRSGLRSGEGTNVVGAGLSFSLPSSKSRIVPLLRTRLEVQIRRQGDQAVLWKGAAVTVRPGSTPTGDDGAVAADLSDALLRGYPAQSDEVISIP